MRFDHVIKNGTLVFPDRSFKANIYIKDGKIFAISENELEGDATEITDATGKYVTPGFIDTHIHSRDGKNNNSPKESFFDSTMAAAIGGITTVYEMPNGNPAITGVGRVEGTIEHLTPKAHVDFALWGLCVGDANMKDIIPLAKAGVVGLKFFWGYAISQEYQLIYNYDPSDKDVIPPLKEGEIYDIFKEVAKTGKMVGIHAENFDLIQRLTEQVVASGDTSYEAFLRARPSISEETTIQTAISFAKATGVHLHILHLASGDAVDIIRCAQKKGINVTAETCPQYLTLSNEDFARVGPQMKGYPPIRTKYDQKLLLEGLLDGTLSFIASDHAPHTQKEKEADLWHAPSGMANVELMVPAMLNEVNKGSFTLNQLVEKLSEVPAKMFGTYPQKGSLDVGTDADITIVDMDMQFTVDRDKLHSRGKVTAMDGFTLRGKPVQTILRGKTIAKDGEIVGNPSGKFLYVK